jgi:hypothetical protein
MIKTFFAFRIGVAQPIRNLPESDRLPQIRRQSRKKFIPLTTTPIPFPSLGEYLAAQFTAEFSRASASKQTPTIQPSL